MAPFKIYIQAIAIGIIAGARSMAAPTITSHRLTDACFGSRLLAALARPGSRRFFTMLAAGEMVADKLPFTPARVAPAPLSARIVSGAVCGAALYAAQGRRPAAGALLGALAAIAGAYGLYTLRRSIGEISGAPDPLLGLLEDGLVVAGGLALTNY